MLDFAYWAWGENSRIIEPTCRSPVEPSGPPNEKCLMFYELKLSKSWDAGQCEYHPSAYVCEIALQETRQGCMLISGQLPRYHQQR